MPFLIPSTTSHVARLAPSPTGAQHLGNARTYLVAMWSARAAGATLRLRIEDLDSPRVKSWASRQAIDDLRWLGIHWDGDAVFQTERTDCYDEVLAHLRDRGHAYPCTCTRTDIAAAASAPHEHVLEGPVYPGTCAGWMLGEPLPPIGQTSWRFRMPRGKRTFVDRVVGRVTCDPAHTLGDFPVTRKGGDAAYQLAVVVDDLEMSVTEIVRGDDLLLSTFRQNAIYEVLGKTPPITAHLPLVVGTDGRRLAKRHGDTRLSTLREQGVAPETIVAWAAVTSGLAQHVDEFRGKSLDQIHAKMVDSFDWRRMPTQPIVVDTTQPDWFMVSSTPASRP